MTTLTPTGSVTIAGVTLECFERGAGPTVLLLHGAGGPRAQAPYLDELAAHVRIIAPTHPGFGGSPLPDWLDSVDDLAYLYLDFLAERDLRDVTVIGFSMGGWTAAEIAVRSTARIAKLVLVDAVGIKVGDRETRDVPDIWALPPAEVTKLTYYDPSLAPKIDEMTDEQLVLTARNREAAAMYLWEPYMHNPKLRRRLRRIDVPTLVLWGANDGLVKPEYGRAYAESIPGARFEMIERAGHSPQLEQPKEFAERVVRFVREG